MSSNAQEIVIYQTDNLGNKQYHKPHFVVEKSGKVVEVKDGVKQYHKKPIQLETKRKLK